MANTVFEQRSLSTLHPQTDVVVLRAVGHNNSSNFNSNARLGEVILLDGRRVEIKIQPRLFAGDLFDMVASHFNLKEKEYFGLAFLDETGQYSWLNLERRVLEHEYAQKSRTEVVQLKNSHSQKEDDAISTVSTTSKSISLKENNESRNRPIHNRRINDLKRKKGSNTQIPSKTPLSKKGSLSNLSGSLRAKLQNGANGVLSRLMASTTSLPQTLSSTLPNSTNTLPAKVDINHHNHLKHHSLSSVHSLELNHCRKNDNKNASDSTSAILNPIVDDPLYDVISEKGNNRDNLGEVNSIFTTDDNGPNDPHCHQHFTTSSSAVNLEIESLSHEHSHFVCNKELLGYENDVENNEMVEEEEEDNRLVLYFLVKYFVESISMLADTTTIELFFLQAKALLINETVQVLDLDTNLTLLALVLQSLYGDISSDSKARHRVHKQQLISSYLLQELATSSTCEDRIIEEYRSLAGTSRAVAIHRFMTLIEKQPTYGVHFYEVKDKSGAPYWLGLSGRGISQFDYEDRRLPKRHFPWKQLENLYFREKKFSIEVRDPKRVVHTLSSINLYENAIEDVDFDDLSSAICDPTTQVSVSRRTFGPCNVTVYVWFAANSSLTKCIWSMAISQHQFYIDRRVTKCHIVCNRSAEEIIASLSASVNGDTSSSSFSAKSVLSPLKSSKSKKRYSITTTTSSASTSASATSRNHHHHQLSTGSLGLSRRFSSLGSIHSRTPSSESAASSSALSSTHSLHSLDSPTATSSSISSPPSALSLRAPGNCDHHSHPHLWDATSDSASLFGGTSISTSSAALHQQNFRHPNSSAASNSRMSRSTSARSSKSLCFRRLRLLETQLSVKLEEVKRLDALEQQILQRAAKAALPPEQVPAMNSTCSLGSSGNASQLHSSSSSHSDQSSSSASSTCSASRNSLATSLGGISGEERSVHYRSALFGNQQQPLSRSGVNHQSSQSKLSLRNFVVTGRNSGGPSNVTCAATSSTDGGTGDHPESLPQQHSRYNSVLSEQSPSPITVNHQRSRSVGLRHGGNQPSSNYSNSLDRKQHRNAQLAKLNSNQVETSKPVENSASPIATSSSNVSHQTLPSSQRRISQLPSFTSPYVNKFDTSVQSLLNGTNLYSVPNRRTSIALNASFDDTFIHTLGKQTISSNSSGSINNAATASNKVAPLNSTKTAALTSSSIDQMKSQTDKNEGFAGGQFLYQFTTTAVTSSVNSVTLSTMSYRYEQRIPPSSGNLTNTSSASLTSATPSIGSFNQQQQQQQILPPPHTISENVYATIGPGSSNSSDSASDLHHNLTYNPNYPSKQLQSHLPANAHPQAQHNNNFFESSVDELDSLPPAPAPPSGLEMIHFHHQYNSNYFMQQPPTKLSQFANGRFLQQQQLLSPSASIDEENLAQYKNALLARRNSFGNGADQQQQQQPQQQSVRLPPGYFHQQQRQKPAQSLLYQQQQQQQQSSPYTAQIRAQTESLYANYANIGNPMLGTVGSSGMHPLVSGQHHAHQQQPSQSKPSHPQQHHYQNAQSLILTHQLPLNYHSQQIQQQQQLNLQLPTSSSRSSPVSQQMSPSRHIYQSVSPLPPPPAPLSQNSATSYTSNSASLSTKKPPKTWFDSDLDFPTGYIRQVAGSKQQQPSINSGTYANESVVNNSNTYQPTSTSVIGQAKLLQHNAPPLIAERESSVDDQNRQAARSQFQPSLLATLTSNSSIPPTSSVSTTYTNSLYLQTPVSASITPHHQNSNSTTTMAGNLFSYRASPTPSNRSSVSSSSASTFIQHTISSSSSSDGSSTFIINRSPTNDGSSANGSAGLLTPTGSVLSLQSAISGNSSVSTNNVVLQPPLYPVATVAFVPSMAGQDAISITATAGSSSSPSSSASSTVGGNYHQISHSGSSSLMPPPTSVPIASCKGNIVEVDVVTVGQCQPGYEEEKPFTISDYYKYSEKYRKAKAAAAAAAAKSTEPGGNTSANSTFTSSSEPILTVPKMESTSQLISRLEGLNLQQPSINGNNSNGNSNNNNNNTTDSFFATAAQVVQGGDSHPRTTSYQNQGQHYHQLRPQLGHFSNSSSVSTVPTPTPTMAAAATTGSTNSDDNNNLPVY